MDQVKRIVVLEPSGLFRIIGTVEGQPPETVEVDDILDLIAVKPRYVLYRKSIALNLGQLGQFHPEQR
mgnify:CR=1 FL=1